MENDKPYLVFREEGSKDPFRQAYCNNVPFDIRDYDDDKFIKRMRIREVRDSLKRQGYEIREVSEGELADLLGNENQDTDSSKKGLPDLFYFP